MVSQFEPIIHLSHSEQHVKSLSHLAPWPQLKSQETSEDLFVRGWDKHIFFSKKARLGTHAPPSF